MNKDCIRVLIVDDDEDDYILIRDYLSEAYGIQYEIEWANSYDSALECIYANLYDVLLLDYRLGEQNGLELLDEIIGSGCKAPVIFLTGQEDHNVDMRAMKSGAYDYLVKNEIKPSLLERSIRYAIERRKMEDELFREKERAIVTLESIGDSVITTDINGNILHLNMIAEKITGWGKKEAVGLHLLDIINIINEITHEPIENPVTEAVKQKKTFKLPGQTVLINHEGREYAIEGTASPIHDSGNQVIGVVVVLHDVTANRELAKRIYYQASHDSLTGMANRFSFEEHLRHLLNNPVYQSQQHALLYLDLDQFKIINDTCGHFAGDQLLKQVALLIRETLRSTDVIARLGGDEFGVLLRNIAVSKACKVADKVCQTIRRFRFTWKDKVFTIGASIGVVGINKDCNDIDGILIAADQSCYMAKEKGGNRYHLCQDNDYELSERNGEMQLILKINKSFEKNNFCLHFQPIVPILTEKQWNWYEILVRIKDEEGRLIYPNAFIPAMQRYNMMLSIDHWVVSNFLSTYNIHYRKEKDKNIDKFNINISGSSLCNEHFLEFIGEQLIKYGIPPEIICFEITETTAISNFNKAIYFIQKLKAMGCRFALDDFGSGLSSFNYLKHLPVDYLKIDGTFIKNITDNSFDFAMVTAINDITHNIGIKTVAEFVENEEIFEKLKIIGVDYAQGYWIGRPTPFEWLDV